MAAVWPETLPPYLLLEGNSEAMADGRLRFETDTGPGKVRRRTSSAVRPFRANIVLTSDQLATFETFLAADLAGGSLPFVLPAQRGSGTWLVRMGDAMPTFSDLGTGNTTVSLTLDRLQ